MCLVPVLKEDIPAVIFCSKFLFLLLTTNNKWVFFNVKLIKAQQIRIVLQVVIEAMRINFLF